MARILIGGKRGNEIAFHGNKAFLPAGIRRVINAYFNNWNVLKDIAQYPNLVQELGEARADRHFLGTDWESLHAFYEAEMLRYTLIFRGAGTAEASLRFTVSAAHATPARPLTAALNTFCTPEGVVKDNYDVWRLEKQLRRAGAQLRFDQSFGRALAVFGARAISFEESLSFYRQVQAYHSPQHLAPELAMLLTPQIDSVHTLRHPVELPALADALRGAGAHIRLHPTVAPVLEHYAVLQAAAAPSEEPATEPPAKDDPRVEAQLRGQLRTHLYPFQREGVAFLTVNRRALLADDMGLGKTLQAIAAALCLKRRGQVKRVLVVCPASLKYQWQAEIQRFSGEHCEVIGGDKSEREAIYRAAAAPPGFIAPEDRPFFFVINYELVFRDLEMLNKLEPDVLIVDEAQRVKNFRTKTAQAVFDLPARCVFVLTGTPLENQLMELYTIMRFIDDRALGRNPVAFRDRYVITDRFGSITGYRRVEEVTRKIAALTLRRTREQALDQLPELVQNNIWLDLTDVQRQIYKELHGQARQLLSDSAWDAAHSNNALTLLQRLREVCDTPELIDPKYTESQKVAELLSLLDEQVGTLDRQVIIFTQWTRMGEIIVRELKTAGLSSAFLHGGVATKDRQALIERFQQGEERIFVSTDAGGTGLNLQAASLVINYDLPFNPAKLNQRVARAHRMGQKETVFAVNLLSRATVEEKLLRILNEKQALFDDVFGDISDPSLARPSVGVQRSLRELLADLLA